MTAHDDAREQPVAGAALDAEIERVVFGRVPCDAWQRGNCKHAWNMCYPADDQWPGGGPRRYSSDIAAAWTVVERLREQGYTTEIRLGSNDRQAWVHLIGKDWGYPNAIALEESLPLAICRAALAALAAARPSAPDDDSTRGGQP